MYGLRLFTVGAFISSARYHFNVSNDFWLFNLLPAINFRCNVFGFFSQELVTL